MVWWSSLTLLVSSSLLHRWRSYTRISWLIGRKKRLRGVRVASTAIGPSPDPWWPLPRPLPRREGAWSPRYPYGQDVGCLLSHYICVFISSNALWNLSGADHLWVLICAQKGSVKSVRSVRERASQRLACVTYHRVGTFSFSQIYTE